LPKRIAAHYEPGENLQKDPTAPPHVGASANSPAAEAHPYTLDCTVNDFILRMLRSAEEDGKDEEEARVAVILENILFYRGEHEMFVTRDCRVESSYEDDDEDDLIKHNWYAHLVEGKAKEWEASKPRIEITGRAPHDHRLEASARLSEALDEFIRETSIKAHFRQSEAKFGLLSKVYYRFAMLVRDDTDETATRIRVPITEKQTFLLGGVNLCLGCETEWGQEDQLGGSVDSKPATCPNCSAGPDHQREVEPPYTYALDVPVDEREEIVPKLRHVCVNPLAVKIDHRARRIQESDYLIFDTLDRRYEIESEFESSCDVSQIESASNLPARLRVMQELERTTAGVNAYAYGERLHTGAREDDLIRKRRFWLLPKKYAHRRVRADETCGGIAFKAGQRIGDVLKPGLLAVVLGESKIAKLSPESKNKRWAGSAFTLDPTTYHGKGTEDWNSIQMSIDDKATLAQSHFDRAAAPTEIIDSRIVDSDEIDGTTGKRVHTKDTVPDNLSAKDAVTVVQAGQLGTDFQNFFQQEPVILREMAGVGRELVGLNDPNNKTARGREVAAAASSSMLIPSLALRAEEVEIETTYQNLEYWQAYGAEEDFALFEAEFGTEAIETFKQLNVRRHLKVKAVPGSWVPLTKDQELQNVEDFAAKYLLPAAQGAMPMSYVRHAASLYNIPSSVFEPAQDAKLAQARLARLRGWADHAFKAGATSLSPAAYELMLDTIINQPEFVPSPIMENHPVHMEFYANQWKGMFDDKNVNPILLDLIDKLHDAHITAMAASNLKVNALKMKAQAPVMAAQQVMQETTHDETMAVQEDSAELQSARDSQMKDEDARRQLALTAAQQEIAPATTSV
jgi:hypothetical protein